MDEKSKERYEEIVKSFELIFLKVSIDFNNDDLFFISTQKT